MSLQRVFVLGFRSEPIVFSKTEAAVLCLFHKPETNTSTKKTCFHAKEMRIQTLLGSGGHRIQWNLTFHSVVLLWSQWKSYRILFRQMAAYFIDPSLCFMPQVLHSPPLLAWHCFFYNGKYQFNAPSYLFLFFLYFSFPPFPKIPVLS